MYIIHNYDRDSGIYSLCVDRLSTTAAQWYEKFLYKQLQYKSLFSRFIYFFVFVEYRLSISNTKLWNNLNC